MCTLSYPVYSPPEMHRGVLFPLFEALRQGEICWRSHTLMGEGVEPSSPESQVTALTTELPSTHSSCVHIEPCSCLPTGDTVASRLQKTIYNKYHIQLIGQCILVTGIMFFVPFDTYLYHANYSWCTFWCLLLFPFYFRSIKTEVSISTNAKNVFNSMPQLRYPCLICFFDASAHFISNCRTKGESGSGWLLIETVSVQWGYNDHRDEPSSICN